MGSGCGSVGRAVASNARGPRFESSHRQKFIFNIYCQLYWKDENKEKEAGTGPFFKKTHFFSLEGVDADRCTTELRAQKYQQLCILLDFAYSESKVFDGNNVSIVSCVP